MVVFTSTLTFTLGLRGHPTFFLGIFPNFGIFGFFPQDGSTAYEEHIHQFSTKNIIIYYVT